VQNVSIRARPSGPITGFDRVRQLQISC
jgi:hypothetical protein